MSKQIWKYHLGLADKALLHVPEESEFLCIKEQRGELYAWILVNTEYTEMLEVPIFIRGTGHNFTGEEGDYIDTIMMSNGLVWHIFTESWDD